MLSYFRLSTMRMLIRFKMVLAISITFALHTGCAQTKTKEFPADLKFKLAFWNLENYFDTTNGYGHDGEFTPEGSMHWTSERFWEKTRHLEKVIHEIKPDILGVCEIENAWVLKQLIAGDSLKKTPYGIVHFESPDERGIDVGLIFNKNKMFVVQSNAIRVALPEGDRTRDILHVKFVIKTRRDTLHVFVNHWPSRREGEEKSSAKRQVAAGALARYIDSLGLETENYVVMGDFNDDPTDFSLRNILGAQTGDMPSGRMVNLPADEPLSFEGTCRYKGEWNRFDQIMLSPRLVLMYDTIALKYHRGSFDCFRPEWITETTGENTGAPFRTFKGKEWLNGYSDHFPVFAELRYE